MIATSPHPFQRGSKPRVRRVMRLTVLVTTLAITLAACERAYWDPTVRVGETPVESSRGDSLARMIALDSSDAQAIALDEEPQGERPAQTMQRGTGTFVRQIAAPTVDTTPGDVTLNFDGTDIREVVKVILGDLLQVNYVLDPAVQGVTSLQTGSPLRREHLIPTLETLLRMNNAAIVYRNGTYEIVPLASAVQGRVVPQLGESTRPIPEGYSVQVVPLQHIGVEEMKNILQPLTPEGSIIRVDTLRNLLVLAGTSPEMSNLLDTIRVFDVDWMTGLSVGFFTLEYAKSSDVVTQMQALLADEAGNPFTGLFRFIPLESANALLVVSPKASYLEQARSWIERLDMAEATGGAAERLFVYRVRHGDAENLADTLSQLFGGEGGSRSTSVGGVAPGLSSSTIGSSTLGSTGEGTESTGGGGASGDAPRRASSRQLELSSPMNIVADATNNSLLIRSSPRDYKKVLDALKQLDIVPLQVLVEATIVEISLKGDLTYGVQWNFFGLATKDHRSNISYQGESFGLKFPGFNWAVVSRPSEIRAVLQALASDNLVNVLSSPSVMVRDNQEAKIQVGKEVPIATSTQTGLSETDRTYNTIQYRPTGVKLSVKPRVTPGGLVQMEIEQEVSTVDPEQTSGIDSPTISTRNITSSVAVRSNQAVVLGGLIEDKRSQGNSGVPGLYNLPFAGPLFGQRSRSSERTELVVVLMPKVIANDQDIEMVNDDFRRKVKGLQTTL